MKKENNLQSNLDSVSKRVGNPSLRVRTRRDEKDPSYKTAALTDKSIIPQGTEEELARELAARLAEIPGHRPIIQFGEPAKTPKKRPISVFTPNGSELFREKSYGFLLIYSNKCITELPRPHPDFDNSKWEETLKKCDGTVKTQEIVCTPKYLEQMDSSRRKGVVRGKNKVPDQQTTMGLPGVNKKEASATSVARKLGIILPKEAWEWLHLIAFMIKGRAAQDPSNLSGGTRDANTDMIFGEDEFVYITFALNEEVKLLVESQEIGAHFAKEIRFTILTDHFMLPFVFDAQTTVTPSFRNKDYIHGLVATLVDIALDKLNTGTGEKQVKRKLNFGEDLASGKQVTPMPLLFTDNLGAPPDSQPSVLLSTSEIKEEEEAATISPTL
jgi:hypothetical protein